MEPQKGSKKALKFVLLFLLAAGFAFSLFPYGASASWHQVFRFFGLTDFSAAADNAPFSMHVLNVGKADSILIECGDRFMLVDGGTADRGEAVTEYLQRRGVKKLDCLVSTHPDSDHIGGLREVVDSIPVERYLAPEIPQNLIPKDEAYLAVQSALIQKHIAAAHPKAGQSFSIGTAKVNVLGPVRAGNSTNNNSIVLKVTFGSTAFLLTGDAEKEEEEDILSSGADLRSDVLKVGHHGSSKSTSTEFLNAVRPRFAAVSVADDTSHLPKDDTVKRLKTAGIKICRTDISGTLIFLSDGKKISLVTERKK
ncbi:MAG TPA: ComEC/Rec2 family competence protein [Caproiciproducens sp.]|nr:ComEC/Rec2 family competence protein [Caproiciproducens sp.]